MDKVYSLTRLFLFVALLSGMGTLKVQEVEGDPFQFSFHYNGELVGRFSDGLHPFRVYYGNISMGIRFHTVFQCWFSQNFGRFSVLLGQHDMNSAFAVNPYAGNLISTSFGILPSIALHQSLSIYPASLPGLMLKSLKIKREDYV